ncbi:MAG: hypothetical protein KKD38_01590 [Candidatus Delongbacteria bacterium]|nr:hypothetical protein [Candidatus Delongbacteria bacterium]MCG2760196.1 hypothetical protein [Candidatus Delongbacteria bacterium]
MNFDKSKDYLVGLINELRKLPFEAEFCVFGHFRFLIILTKKNEEN